MGSTTPLLIICYYPEHPKLWQQGWVNTNREMSLSEGVPILMVGNLLVVPVLY